MSCSFNYWTACGMILALVAATGCLSPQEKAQRAVEEELRERRQQQAQSDRLYDQAMEAYKQSYLDRELGVSPDLDKAQDLLRQSVAAYDGNANAWMALGVVAYEKDEFFDAARAFDRAARLMPTRYEPRFNLGSIFEMAGHYEKAISEYETALRLAPDQVEVMENLARCYIRTGRKLQEAKRLVDRALLTELRLDWRAWLERQAIRLSQTSTPPSTVPGDGS